MSDTNRKLGNTGEVVAGLSALPAPDYIAETKKLYGGLGYPDYAWAERTEAPAFVPIDKPLSECTVMLVASGGIYVRGQVALHTKDDTSIRIIPTDTASEDLRINHFAYDWTDASQDPNCVFPLERLKELAADGTIGAVADQAIGFMGGIYSTRRLMAETAEHILAQVKAQEPDLVLLVPV